jgi:hypothetical protein
MNPLRNACLALLVAVLLLTAPGQAQDKPKALVIPEAKDLTKIRVEIYETTAAKGYEVIFDNEKSMKPVLDWLKSIDFDPAKGRDGKNLKLGHFGQIVLVLKKGDPWHIGVSDKVIIPGLLYAADTDKLKEIVKAARK